MSRLVTNAIRSTAASSDAMTIDSAGKPAFPNGGVGKILQAVSATKTDHFSTTSSSLVEITGLNVSITPSASTSKILLNIDISVGGATAYIAFNIKRDSTLIAVTTAVDGNDVRHQGSFGQVIVQNSGIHGSGFNFLDTPSTTSAITYKVFVISTYNNQTVNINRSHNTSNAVHNFGGCSTITAMEVAA
tara:strand:+ start:230 stop:796 length:567 start_codon:yes stop_codon:yes gene_type:complete